MLISNLQNLNCHFISSAKQVAEPFFNDTTIKVFQIALAIFAALAIISIVGDLIKFCIFKFVISQNNHIPDIPTTPTPARNNRI
jgi:hypothetical protein